MKSKIKSALTVGVALCALNATAAFATSQSFTAPNVITTAGATQVTLGGRTFVNQGLQGMARLPAATRDFNGDTLGAFSGMDLILSNWRKTSSGYSGTIYSLPDRGPNGVGQVTFSDYPGRVSRFGFTFTPYTGTANLPADASSQNQMVMTQQGGFFFRDFSGNLTTGLDPGTGPTAVVTQNGIQLPGSTTGVAANKIALDAEGVRFLRDGSFYVSDEYGANVYYFNSTGQLQGVIRPPAAVTPRDAQGNLIFSSLVNATTGRRLNQGLEGMAVTPDGKRLATLLQSATMQDTNGANQQTRNNTRLMVYDISGAKTPSTPVAEYILELPVFNATGNGAPNRTAAQSDMLALNSNQFLVLSRDGNGLGLDRNNPVYKTILLVDTTGATNIIGTAFSSTNAAVATNGVLNSTIVPVQQVELVNMLNSTQLTKFGENINNVTPTRLTLGEKWEGLALAPVLEESAPQDFFLFVGNDNDFLSSSCRVGGQDCAQAVDSDTHVLIYRLTLPTYVDPEYLAAMDEMAPASLVLTGQSAISLAQTNAANIASHLNARHYAGATTEGFSAWISGTYNDDKWKDAYGAGADVARNGTRGTVGIDYGFSEDFSAGLALGYGKQTTELDTGHEADASAYSFGGYVQFTREGFHGFAGLSGGHVDLDGIERPAAYGLTAQANTDGKLISGFIEAGYAHDFGGIMGGPVGTFSYDRATLDAYTETGAAGGNIMVPEQELTSQVAGLGGEVYGNLGSVTPSLRLSYNWQMEDETRDVAIALASAQHAMGAINVTLPTLEEDYAEVALGLQGQMGRGLWHVGYSAQFGAEDRTSHIVRAGVSFGF